jgi:hypothetical protein
MHAHDEYPDIIPAFLRELRRHGHKEPFCGPLRRWLHTLQDRPPPGVPADVIEGTLVLLGECGSDPEQAAPIWRALLRHSSSYVRACAARMLNEECGETTPHVDPLPRIEWVNDIPVAGWRIRKKVLRSERRLARRLRAAMAGKQRYSSHSMSRAAPPSGLRLEDWFEFFLSASVQVGCGNPRLWCDGAYALDITRSRRSPKRFKVRGVAYVCDGRIPGSHTHPRILKLSGVMQLAPGGNRFSDYVLTMRGVHPGSLWGWRGRFILRPTGLVLRRMPRCVSSRRQDSSWS